MHAWVRFFTSADSVVCYAQVSSANGQVFHPIIYAFLREATAGPIMCGLAWFSTGAQSCMLSLLWGLATSHAMTEHAPYLLCIPHLSAQLFLGHLCRDAA